MRLRMVLDEVHAAMAGVPPEVRRCSTTDALISWLMLFGIAAKHGRGELRLLGVGAQ
jgi:hypothetical protein